MPDAAEAKFVPASDQSLLVRFSDRVTPEAHEQVMKLLRSLQNSPIPAVRNLQPAYSSLLISFNALALPQAQLEADLRSRLADLEHAPAAESKIVDIPVCYGGPFGPDLNEVASLHGLSAPQVIELHAAADYVVMFLGFAPGFGYLGGLPELLGTPRLATPRRRVAPGSVGIAGNQTAVYPFATPGGWRLIGRTPLAMFRPDRQPMSLLAIGDHVRFKAVSGDEFASLEQAGK